MGGRQRLGDQRPPRRRPRGNVLGARQGPRDQQAKTEGHERWRPAQEGTGLGQEVPRLTVDDVLLLHHLLLVLLQETAVHCQAPGVGGKVLLVHLEVAHQLVVDHLRAWAPGRAEGGTRLRARSLPRVPPLLSGPRPARPARPTRPAPPGPGSVTFIDEGLHRQGSVPHVEGVRGLGQDAAQAQGGLVIEVSAGTEAGSAPRRGRGAGAGSPEPCLPIGVPSRPKPRWPGPPSPCPAPRCPPASPPRRLTPQCWWWRRSWPGTGTSGHGGSRAGTAGSCRRGRWRSSGAPASWLWGARRGAPVRAGASRPSPWARFQPTESCPALTSAPSTSPGAK